MKSEFKAKVEEMQWHVQSAPSFIAQSLNLQQKLFERNKSRKGK